MDVLGFIFGLAAMGTAAAAKAQIAALKQEVEALKASLQTRTQ